MTKSEWRKIVRQETYQRAMAKEKARVWAYLPENVAVVSKECPLCYLPWGAQEGRRVEELFGSAGDGGGV